MTALEKELASHSTQVLRTREPGGTPLGDEIRNMILRIDGQFPTARTELLLYEANRAQHVDLVIRPALEQNKWVLCDRFIASSVAFQAGGRKISTEWVERLNEFAADGIAPDLTVLLDLSVEESHRRRTSRQSKKGGRQDRIESEADNFHERVRQSFLGQAAHQPQKWLILDAAKSTDELLEQLLAHLRGMQWFN